MVSTEKTKLETISFHGNSLNKSHESDKVTIENYLQEIHWNSVGLDSLKLRNCNLTDDLFLHIVNVLKFVKNIDLDGNKLTLQSLLTVLKVSLLSLIHI